MFFLLTLPIHIMKVCYEHVLYKSLVGHVCFARLVCFWRLVDFVWLQKSCEFGQTCRQYIKIKHLLELSRSSKRLVGILLHVVLYTDFYLNTCF
jgi:hypothetical protein